jgi:hypothetical protein
MTIQDEVTGKASSSIHYNQVCRDARILNKVPGHLGGVATVWI